MAVGYPPRIRSKFGLFLASMKRLLVDFRGSEADCGNPHRGKRFEAIR